MTKLKKELLLVIDKLKEDNVKENKIILKAIQKQIPLQEGQENQVNQVEEDGE